MPGLLEYNSMTGVSSWSRLGTQVSFVEGKSILSSAYTGSITAIMFMDSLGYSSDLGEKHTIVPEWIILSSRLLTLHTKVDLFPVAS